MKKKSSMKNPSYKNSHFYKVYFEHVVLTEWYLWERLLEGLEILFRSPTDIALNSILSDNKR